MTWNSYTQKKRMAEIKALRDCELCLLFSKRKRIERTWCSLNLMGFLKFGWPRRPHVFTRNADRTTRRNGLFLLKRSTVRLRCPRWDTGKTQKWWRKRKKENIRYSNGSVTMVAMCDHFTRSKRVAHCFSLVVKEKLIRVLNWTRITAILPPYIFFLSQ